MFSLQVSSSCFITNKRHIIQNKINTVRSVIKMEKCVIEKEVLYRKLNQYKQELKLINEDPLVLFCKDEPWADECRVYDV